MEESEKPLAKPSPGDPPLPELESRHFEWLFSAAQIHFVEQIERLELDNLRHQAHAGKPYYRPSMSEPADREEKIRSNDRYLAQYRTIVEFCIAVRKRVLEYSSQEFAKQVMPEIKKRRP